MDIEHPVLVEHDLAASSSDDSVGTVDGHTVPGRTSGLRFERRKATLSP